VGVEIAGEELNSVADRFECDEVAVGVQEAVEERGFGYLWSGMRRISGFVIEKSKLTKHFVQMTRQLISEKKVSIFVGFYFSLSRVLITM